MSHDYRRGPGQESVHSSDGHGLAAGKRTLTAQLRPAQDVPPPMGALTTSYHDTGGGRALDEDVRGTMEHAFGADFSSVRVHEGEHVPQMGALAYAQGTDLHFAPGQYAPGDQRGRELIGHELAHVVQQSQGRVAATTQAKGLAVNDDSSLEREADDLGARAARGERVAAAGAATITPSASSNPAQCYAFVAGTQVEKTAKNLTSEQMKLVQDDKVRSYTDDTEFGAHASKTTDYLGNLKDGTWVRFSDSGINLLGEDHTLVTLIDVIQAVGSTSFIYEPFSNDDLADGSKMKASYETENADRFKEAGVDKVKDKKQFGAESLYPKMGVGMVLALPFFSGKESLDGLKKADYVGQPIQRYLKIGWGYSADNLAEVTLKLSKNEQVAPKALALSVCHAKVSGALDGFITGLPIDGFLGDALDTVDGKKLLPSLYEFAIAFSDAMLEKAAEDPSSRMDKKDRSTIMNAKGSFKPDVKENVFDQWRDFKFEDSVEEATNRGVRYAGMGQNHLKHLIDNGLIVAGQHTFKMADTDLQAFQTETQKLGKKAVSQQ